MATVGDLVTGVCRSFRSLLNVLSSASINFVSGAEIEFEYIASRGDTLRVVTSTKNEVTAQLASDTIVQGLYCFAVSPFITPPRLYNRFVSQQIDYVNRYELYDLPIFEAFIII